MMRKALWSFFLLFATLAASRAQDPGADSLSRSPLQLREDTLAVLAYAMVNDSTPVNRFAACRKFIPSLVECLKEPGSFDHPFERIRQVSILYPADSSFRLFSWQLYIDEDEYHYYGAIQLHSDSLRLYPLIDRSATIADLPTATFGPENWYGQLYYNLVQFEGSGGRQYLLFGYEANSFFTRRKILDVLRFDELGQPVFGAPVFQLEDSSRVNRWVLDYGANASVRLNYDQQLDIIVFDHLVEMGSPYPGQRSMRVPDGDTDAFVPEDGLWKFRPRIFDQVMEEAPRPEPVLDQDNRDLFGKEKK